MKHLVYCCQNEAFDELLSDYPEVTISRLRVQFGLFQVQYKFGTVSEAAAVLRGLSNEYRALFIQAEVLVRFLLLVPASSATAERSFSALRRIKTWLRSTMSQARLNHVSLLNIHSKILDTLDLNAVVADFIAKNDGRVTIFGKVSK